MAASRTKPRLFIGSSKESLRKAHGLQQNLDEDAEVTVWSQGVFQLSRSNVVNLLGSAPTFDFAAFIFADDDVTHLRNEEFRVVRDNVVFELGLFAGVLGIDRCFIVHPRGIADFHLPTDLAGLVPALYESKRSDNNWAAALGPAAEEIRTAMEGLGSRELYAESSPALDAMEESPDLAGGKMWHSLRERLVSSAWRLVSNPKTRNERRLTLDQHGNVVVGANQYENRWRLKKSLELEFLQDNGEVHSRFRWDWSSERWVDTNESDVRKRVRDQYLEPVG